MTKKEQKYLINGLTIGILIGGLICKLSDLIF